MGDQELAAQIRAHAPGGARAYFLTNYAGRIPTQGGFGLDPITMPMGVPAGEYRLGYLTESTSNLPLQPRNANNPHPTIRITGEDGKALAVTPATPEKPVKTVKDPIDDDPEHLRNRVEFEAIRMVDKTIKAKHLIGKRLERTRELGESLVLHKAHRQEWEQLMRAASQSQRESLAQQRDNLAYQRTLIKHSQEMADMTMETLRRYAQPPDPSGPFTGMFGQILGFLGTLIGGKGKDEKVFDAILGSDDDDETKVLAIKKKLKALRKELDEKEAAQAGKKKGESRRKKKETKGSQKRGSTKQEPTAKAKSSDKRKTAKKAPEQAEEKGTRQKKAARRKALPAKGGT